MTRIDLIKSFPILPEFPILYVMYNNDMIESARQEIINIWGAEYTLLYVTVTDLESLNDYSGESPFTVYLDPSIHSLRQNGYN